MAKLPDTPEGLGVDSHGNLYATLMHIGEVVMLKDDGSYDHIAWVPSKEESGKGDLHRTRSRPVWQHLRRIHGPFET